ncbi:hypothetical protein [Nonomuraea sp. NPDC049625]|uniref:hypothetical protein n=1 Tax=Nonomuraea sp. NPDC049625 TaxID=3155775 RepID=UPI00341835D9
MTPPPTDKVAVGPSPATSRTVPMLSLDNVFSPGTLASWAAGLARRLGRRVTAWSVEPKYDGLAISAHYRGGRLLAEPARFSRFRSRPSRARRSRDRTPTRGRMSSQYSQRRLGPGSRVAAGQAVTELDSPPSRRVGVLVVVSRDSVLILLGGQWIREESCLGSNTTLQSGLIDTLVRQQDTCWPNRSHSWSTSSGQGMAFAASRTVLAARSAACPRRSPRWVSGDVIAEPRPSDR